MKEDYVIRDLVTKTTYKDKTGKDITKWHNIGAILTDKEGKMFGTINVWGHPVKYSVFDKKEKMENNPTTTASKEDSIDGVPF